MEGETKRSHQGGQVIPGKGELEKRESEKRTNRRIVQGVVQLSAFVTVSNISTYVLQTFKGWVGIGLIGACLPSPHHHVHYDPLHHKNETKLLVGGVVLVPRRLCGLWDIRGTFKLRGKVRCS